MRFEVFIIPALFCMLARAADIPEIPKNLTQCSIRETINITEGGALDNYGRFHHNGLIYEPGKLGEPGMFAEFDYIFVNATHEIPTEPHVRGCICELKQCIRLCRLCSSDDVIANGTCIKSNVLSLPNADGGVMEEVKLDNGKYQVLVGKTCKEMFKLDAVLYPEDDVWYFDNGVAEVSSGLKLDYRDSCFVQNETRVDGVYETLLLQCLEESVGDTHVEQIIYPAGMLISLPFLLITFFVYAFIPELHNLHGKCLMSYIVALMIFFTGLIVVNWEQQFRPQEFWCKFFGYMIFIGVQLCFFWLNVMCYDIWSAFKIGMRGHGSDRKRFMFYSIYAFGVPILFTLLVYIIDSTEFVPLRFRPQMGEKRCYIIDSKTVEAIYVYIPISIILVVNIILYSITAYTINRVQRETAIIRRGESQRHSRMDADKDKFFLYLRLFIVMGVTWIMESVSFLFKTPYIFYVTDILNCLQGFLIFVFFVWKKKVRKLIVRRYRSLRGLPPPTDTAASKTESSKISMSSYNIHNDSTLPISEKPMIKNNF